MRKDDYDNTKERIRRGLDLKHLRKSKGLEQKDLAKIVGVSRNHLSNVETGKASPTMAKFDDWCRKLGAVVMIIAVPNPFDEQPKTEHDNDK